MSEEKSQLSVEFEKVGDSLDRIIKALRRENGDEPIPDHPETLVWYQNGAISSFNMVGSIDDEPFPNKNDIVKVEVGNTVTEIGWNTFGGHENLLSVTIPNSVKVIGQSAFNGCVSLVSIVISDGITLINDYAFFECLSLSKIICKALNAPSISQYAFGNDTSNYVGRNTYNTENNVLKIPQGATYYNTGAWLDPLQDSEKCGFHIEYI